MGRRRVGILAVRWWRAADPIGDGLEDALAGNPALHVLPVRRQDGQAVVAAGLELPERMGERLAGAHHLRVACVDDVSW